MRMKVSILIGIVLILAFHLLVHCEPFNETNYNFSDIKTKGDGTVDILVNYLKKAVETIGPLGVIVICVFAIAYLPSILSIVGVLGLVVLTILYMPSVLAYIFGSEFVANISSRGLQEGFNINRDWIMERWVELQKVWDEFDIRDENCRQKFICEIHVQPQNLGVISRTAMGILDQLSSWNLNFLPKMLQDVLKEYEEAAVYGRKFSDCNKYSKCLYSFAKQKKQRAV